MLSKTLRLTPLLSALVLAPLAFAGGGGMGGGGMGGMGGPGGMGGGGMGGMGGGGPGGMGGGGMGGMGGGGMGGMGGGGMGGGGMGGGGMGGPGGMGGGFTRMTTAEAVRQQVGFNDDEWSVIQPKLQKVIDAQNVLRVTTNTRAIGGGGGMGGGMGGLGGAMGGAMGGAPAATTQPTPVQQAQTELATTLQDPASSTEVISAKLKALRDARAKAKESLTAAQDDLKKVLTVRQEAILVNLGYLE